MLEQIIEPTLLTQFKEALEKEFWSGMQDQTIIMHFIKGDADFGLPFNVK